MTETFDQVKFGVPSLWPVLSHMASLLSLPHIIWHSRVGSLLVTNQISLLATEGTPGLALEGRV